MNFAAGWLWHVPGAFGVARALGPRYSLRSVLFHNVSDTESPFTRGLGGTITPKNFEAALRFLTKHYTPVSLQDVLASFDGRALPPRPVLVTFDDGYASVSEVAAPLCSKFGVPAVVFVNAASLDNRQLVLDNLICYVANVFGLDTINAAIRALEDCAGFEVNSLTEIFARFLPSISLKARKSFRHALVRLTKVSEPDLAAEAGLYLSSQQLRELTRFNFEIGDHTYTHVHGRPLSSDDFKEEIEANRALLEAASGTKLRSYSVPYGSAVDLTRNLRKHLQHSGYEAIFLAEGRANSPRCDRYQLNRVSVRASSDAALFSEIEVLPRLRSARSLFVGAANTCTCSWISDLEKTKQPSRLFTSSEDAGITREIPKANSGT